VSKDAMFPLVDHLPVVLWGLYQEVVERYGDFYGVIRNILNLGLLSLTFPHLRCCAAGVNELFLTVR
jgi:hypothetical protein